MINTYDNINPFCNKCYKPKIYVGDMPLGGWTKGQEPYCTCDRKSIADNSNINYLNYITF